MKIEYYAKTDQATIVNLTNHSYWNLSGTISETILNHELTLKCNKYLPIDNNLIPTGEIKEIDEKLTNLPVARAIWKPVPDLKIAVTAWILAGGAHHTGFSLAISAEHMEDFAEIANMEFLLIDKDININDFKKELRWNEAYYKYL